MDTSIRTLLQPLPVAAKDTMMENRFNRDVQTFPGDSPPPLWRPSGDNLQKSVSPQPGLATGLHIPGNGPVLPGRVPTGGSSVIPMPGPG